MHNSVQQVLGAFNLALDPEVTSEIVHTVRNMQNQDLGSQMKELEVVAVAALVAQNKRLLAVDNHTLVSAGFSIESFMSQVSSQNRGFFLELVEMFSLKWNACSVSVKSKITTLKSLYSLYVNYHKLFVSLAKAGGFPAKLAQTLASIFWLAYIQKGTKQDTTKDPGNQRKKLSGYLEWLFLDFFGVLSSAEVHHVCQLQHYVEGKMQSVELQEVTKRVLGNLYNICQERDRKSENLHSQLLRDNFAELFLQDYVNSFALRYESQDSVTIQHTNFFNHNRLLTPRPKPRDILKREHIQPISQRLQFQSSEEQEQEVIYWRFSEEATPSDNNFQKLEEAIVEGQKQLHQNMQVELVAVPNIQISGRDRLNALNWVNKVSGVKRQDFERCEVLFKNTFGQNWSSFIEINEKIVEKFIIKVASSCSQVESKSKKALSVFQHLFVTILEKNNEQQVKSMFEQTKNFNGFIFISVMLTLCAYKIAMPSLSVCLREFGITSENAFIPINWIGTNIEMPQGLKNYIMEVERALLLRQIWSERTGYQLLQATKQKKVTYLQSSVMRRLKKHTQSCVSQLCENNQEIVRNLFAIIALIEDKHMTKFLYNSIEAIIIAAYALAQSKNNVKKAVQSVLKAWKNMKHYFVDILCYFSESGNKIPLQTFLRQLSIVVSVKEDTQITVQVNERKEKFLVLGQMDPQSYVHIKKQ